MSCLGSHRHGVVLNQELLLLLPEPTLSLDPGRCPAQVRPHSVSNNYVNE